MSWEPEVIARDFPDAMWAVNHVTKERMRYVPERTCHLDVLDNIADTFGEGDVWFECDECYWQMDIKHMPSITFKHCPGCGAEVIER